MDASFQFVEKMVSCPTFVLGKYFSINRANTRGRFPDQYVASNTGLLALLNKGCSFHNKTLHSRFRNPTVLSDESLQTGILSRSSPFIGKIEIAM
jgi:hypothetical protein